MTDPDLHHAISMRPHPFHSNPEHLQSEGFISLTPAESVSQKHPGSSTAFEATTPGSEIGEPINRPTFAKRNSTDNNEAERQIVPTYSESNDPYSLRKGLMTDDEIQRVRANMSRKRASKSGCATPFAKGQEVVHTKRLRGFYEAQNDNIERLLKPVDEHVREAKEEQGSDALQFKIAVYGSFAANICLAVLQLYGAIASGSLSLFTTMADAVFDPLSNLTLLLSNRAVNRVDPRRFPSGKARIETAGNITFCFIMTAVSLVLIVLSARELAEGSDTETSEFHLPSVVAVATAFCVKLSLFFYCWGLRNKYSQIRILWEDHRNDLLINGFGVLTSVGGAKLRWWIDPMGAILLSCLISFLWLRTAWSEFQLLIGVSADTQFLQHITYISMTHSETIRQLDTVRAWHSGPRLIVEVDIVMDPDMSLRETHDVAEALQMKLESLPDVERAYVHVDYETSHAPEHFLKKEL